MSTYSSHAAICAKFYDLTMDAPAVSKFVLQNSRAKSNSSALFVGSIFEVARELITAGLNITVVDYSEEMVAVGCSKLEGVKFETADLRSLPYHGEFDVVFVIGRVFTHMISDADVTRAISSCRRALRAGGHLFFDNYEASKIQKTWYFNGVIKGTDGQTVIRRESSTTKISDVPYVVRWDAKYTGTFEGSRFSFSDSMDHRAFSRKEITRLLSDSGFEVLAQGDNFDETSFFTLAVAR